MTAHMLAATRTKPMPEDEFAAMWKALRNYLACDQPQEPDDQKPDLDALALMQQKQKAE